MKPLFALDRLIGKVESALLVASLAALLLLTLYSVAYRNLLAPVVLKMQARAAQSSTEVGAVPGGAQAPAAVPGEARGGGGTEEPPKPSEGAPAGDDFAGDLDDEEAPAAPATGDRKAPATGQGDFAGDLDEEGPAASPVEAPARPAAPPTADVAAAAATTPSQELAAPPESLLLRILKFLNFGWIDTVTRHLLLWIAFLGGAVATRYRRHIKIDALSRLLPEEGRNRLTILLDVAAIAVCVVMARAAWKFMTSESETDAVFYGSLPVWVGIAIIPVGFGLLIWHFSLDCLLEILWNVGVRSPELVRWREELHQSQGEVA